MPITDELHQILFEGKSPAGRRDRPDGPAPERWSGNDRWPPQPGIVRGRLQGMGRRLRRPGPGDGSRSSSARGGFARSPGRAVRPRARRLLALSHRRPSGRAGAAARRPSIVCRRGTVPSGPIAIRAPGARRDARLRDDDEATLPALEEFHVLTDETVREPVPLPDARTLGPGRPRSGGASRLMRSSRLRIRPDARRGSCLTPRYPPPVSSPRWRIASGQSVSGD